MLSYKVLYSGSTNIPSKDNGGNVIINLTDSISNYQILIIVRSSRNTNFVYLDKGTASSAEYSITNPDASSWGAERFNNFNCFFSFPIQTQMKVYGNVYNWIHSDGASGNADSYTGMPLTRVTGITLR